MGTGGLTSHSQQRALQRTLGLAHRFTLAGACRRYRAPPGWWPRPRGMAEQSPHPTSAAAAPAPSTAHTASGCNIAGAPLPPARAAQPPAA